MTPEWVAEERRLWDAMWNHHANVAETVRNQALIKKYKLKHSEKDHKKIREALGLVTSGEATRDSWRRFERWREH
jgi:hypothetical protein